MTAALILAGVLVLIVAVVLGLAATKPETISVQRETEIHAPASRVFDLLNDFHHWPEWAPQDQEDASMKRTFSGAASGVGAVSEWRGRGSTGQGKMEIVESAASSKITVKVDFERPFVAHNANEFILVPTATGTRVIWKMTGTNPFMAKVMSVFMNMDKMMGQHFESGLKSLKKRAESR